jgi:6-pyruvoyltetrahydropterin/6-carboxytetrahydropterin synthase
VEGPLGEHHLVLDFETLDAVLRTITRELDHKVLLPLESRELSIEQTKESVTVSFRERRWVFPREECVLLPVPGTTAELLARWVSRRLREDIETRWRSRLLPGTAIRVEVREAPGQSAFHETRR